jgi:hypothetical protein
MQRTRKFHPSSMLALEDRALLTHVVNLTADLGNLSRPPADVAQSLSTSDMVPGAAAAPAGGNTFPLDIQQTLQAGLPVYEQRQTVYSNKVNNQFVDELIVPSGTSGDSTTTEWISDTPNSANSVEKLVNVKTVNGNTTTNNITITLPGGTVETEVGTAVHTGSVTTHSDVTALSDGTIDSNTYVDIQKGRKELIKDGSETAADGGIDTYSGVKYTVGDKTYTQKTFYQRGRLVKNTESVVKSFGDAGQAETNTTTMARGRETITNNETMISRLNPPTS